MWGLPHTQKTSFNRIINFRSFFVAIFFRFVHLQSCLGQGTSLRDEMLFTDSQKEAFERFKNESLRVITTPYMKNDIVLIKYFRYADMNENKALEILEENLKWRFEQELNPLSEDDRAELERTYSFYSVFQDKFGREVYFIPMKYVDCSVITKTPEFTQKTIKFLLLLMEGIYKKACSNITGKTKVGLLLLSDFKDFPAIKINGDCIAGFAKVVNDALHRFPGGTNEIINVNVDAMVVPAGKLVVRTFPPDFQKQTQVLDENDAVWMPELLKMIEKDKIPPDLYIRSQNMQLLMVPPASSAGGGQSFFKVFEQKTKEGSGTKEEKTNQKDDDDDDDDDDKTKKDTKKGNGKNSKKDGGDIVKTSKKNTTKDDDDDDDGL